MVDFSFWADISECRVSKRCAQSALMSRCKLVPTHHCPCLFHVLLLLLPTLYSCSKVGLLTWATIHGTILAEPCSSQSSLTHTCNINLSFRWLVSVENRRLLHRDTICLSCSSKTTYWKSTPQAPFSLAHMEF